MPTMNRFPHEKFASLELNQVAFPKTGMVVSQMPLGEAFTAAAPCENGMWVVADKAVGVLNAPTAATNKLIGIVYTAEKEYGDGHTGLKNFGYKIAGDYPRVGILALGDTVTTNCLQYDTSVFANDAALDTYLSGDLSASATAAYVTVEANSPIPKIVKTNPGSGIVGRIVKYYTVPNGEKGVKYQIVSL